MCSTPKAPPTAPPPPPPPPQKAVSFGGSSEASTKRPKGRRGLVVPLSIGGVDNSGAGLNIPG